MTEWRTHETMTPLRVVVDVGSRRAHPPVFLVAWKVRDLLHATWSGPSSLLLGYRLDEPVVL